VSVDGAFLINAARGGIVDEKALAAALVSGKLAGAGLDVFATEPMVEPALLQVPNVLLQPHTGSATHVARLANTENQIANVLNVLSRGVAPLTPVNAPAHPKLTDPSLGPVGRARL
jgi:phosphoglycerate dehydrogenase-like enzyme